MAYNESDSTIEQLNEIRKIKNELASLDKKTYEISMTRKFLNHRLSDLEYDLKHSDISNQSKEG